MHFQAQTALAVGSSLVGGGLLFAACALWVVMHRWRASPPPAPTLGAVSLMEVAVGRLLTRSLGTVNQVLFGARGERFGWTFAFYCAPTCIWVVADLETSGVLQESDLFRLTALVVGHTLLSCVVLRSGLLLVLGWASSLEAGGARGWGLMRLTVLTSVLMGSVGLVRHVLSVGVLPELLAGQVPTLALIGEVGRSLLGDPWRMAPDAVVLMVPMAMFAVCLLAAAIGAGTQCAYIWSISRLREAMSEAESREHLRVGINLLLAVGAPLLTLGAGLLAQPR